MKHFNSMPKWVPNQCSWELWKYCQIVQLITQRNSYGRKLRIWWYDEV